MAQSFHLRDLKFSEAMPPVVHLNKLNHFIRLVLTLLAVFKFIEPVLPMPAKVTFYIRKREAPP